MRFFSIVMLLLSFHQIAYSQQLAILQYKGGGDWYANPTALPNLIAFTNEQINTRLNPKPAVVKAESNDIFNYPFIHMTGHGNVSFDEVAIENIRTYLLSGGFLHIDDNYGMQPYITRELKKLFPEKSLTEIPVDHPIYDQKFKFPNGLPKIHEHDNKPPQALGLFEGNRLILLFTYESDLGDGWEDQAVHNDPEDIRLKALRMGSNILSLIHI